MTMRWKSTVAIVVAGLFLVGALLVCRQAVAARERAVAALAALEAEQRGLQAERGALQRRIEAADRTRSELAAARAPKSGANGPAVSTQPGRAAPPRTMSEIIENNPKLEVLELKRQRAAAAQEYNVLFRQLGLSSEQRAKFIENCVQHAERGMDLGAAGRAQDEAGKRTVAALREQAKADFEASQAAVLGPDGYRRYQQFNDTIPIRNIVIRGAAAAAALEGVPFSAEQGEELVQAALRASEAGAHAGSDSRLLTLDWAALDAEARRILTPQQFEFFAKVATPAGFESRWKYQLDAAIRRARLEEAAAAPKSASKPDGD
jgi:hypothetical protein